MRAFITQLLNFSKKSSIELNKLDKLKKAKAPGKRKSKYGNKYWETRKNRSDVIGSRL